MTTRKLRHVAVSQALTRALPLLCCLLAPTVSFANVKVASDAKVLLPGLVLRGPTSPSRPMIMAVILPSRDPLGAAAFAAHVSKPGDPLYRQYLTPAAYAARFGALPADYAAVVAWATAHGLVPGEQFTARTVLPLSGSAAAFSAALGVKFNDMADSQNHVGYAADAEPRLPEAIASRITAVLGLVSSSRPHAKLRRLPAGAHPALSGTGPGGAYGASDLRTIYNVVPQPFAKPQTLAAFEQGGFAPSDVTTYLMRNKLPPVPVVARGVDSYGGGIDDPDVELEAVLDIDMEISINPAAKQVIVYEASVEENFSVALADAFSAMATDDRATSIDVSYGQDEALQGPEGIAAENVVLTQLAAQGQALFVSSGDDGAYGDEPPTLNVSDPASQPLVTAVGGTTLFTGPKERYYVEETWNDLGAGLGATGGGISSIWSIPDYQIQFGQSVALYNGGSSTYRNVPDVASDANPVTGVAVYSGLNGGWVLIGGTSVAAPIWAGFYSLANAASEGLGFGPAGFANPAIYSLGSEGGHLYPDFNDVYDGNNGNPNYGPAGFSAGYGYDNTTGFGSFSGNDLMIDLALEPTNANSNPPPAPTDLVPTATPTSITLSWEGATGNAGYLFFAYNYNTFATITETLSKKTKVTLSGLSPNTTYVFQVVAIAAGGTTISVPTYVTTPKAGSK